MQDKVNDKLSLLQMVRWLWKAYRGNRLQAMLNAVIGLVGVGVSLSAVWAMQRAIDTASGVRPGSVFEAVGLMAVLILCEFGIGISRVWIRNILGVKAQNRMQQQLLAQLLRAQWQGREALHSGDVVNRLEDDVKTVVGFLTETIPSTLSTLAMFAGAFLYLLRMDVWLAVTTVAILPVFLLLGRFYVSRMRRLSRKVRKLDGRVQSILTETVQHRMLLKTMQAEPLMLSRLDSVQQQLRSRVKHRTVFSVASNLMVNLGFSLSYLLAFLWGAVRLSQGTLSFGGMTAFLQLVFRIQGPARDLTRLAPAFVGVLTAAERLMQLQQLPEEEQGQPLLLASPCGVRFCDVTYYYNSDDQQPTLQHAHFDFAPNTCTAVFGTSGSGKTTLIRLLLALIRPQEGRIEIYSHASSASPHAVSLLSPLHRCNFVYVPQGNTLLSGTVRDNLLIGCPHATDDAMAEALRRACAHFVFDLPDGLNTMLAEQGGGLSEGQAQRIAIARALLQPGNIMLLDEATSALDPETEQQVLQNILSSGQKTVIVVSHRPAVAAYCDHVIYMD